MCLFILILGEFFNKTLKQQLTWNTANQWASGESAGALADTNMVFWIANGATAAWARIITWIHTSFISACSIKWTIVIGITIGWINCNRMFGCWKKTKNDILFEKMTIGQPELSEKCAMYRTW